MKKRSLILILILCACLLISATAACTDDNEKESAQDNSVGTDTDQDSDADPDQDSDADTDQDSDADTDQDSDADTDPVPVTEVTAEEWSAAFGKEITQFTYSQKVIDTDLLNVMKFDAVNNVYYLLSLVQLSDGYGEFVEIDTETDGNYYYYYTASDGGWIRLQTEQSFLAERKANYNIVISLVFEDMADKFGVFTYDGEKYVASDLELMDSFAKSFESAEVRFENGALKSIKLSNENSDDLIAGYSIEIGAPDIEMPAEYDDVLLNVRGGSYYAVGSSATGWQIIEDTAITFKPQGEFVPTDDMLSSCTFTIYDGYIEINMKLMNVTITSYAVPDGKFLWCYENKSDTGVFENMIAMYYEGTELSQSDIEKITEKTGDDGKLVNEDAAG